ncbi:MAG: hypothetical protein SFV21_00175 [Rhodospirillaceae bacterium]|nr:hypothetical protein [Rhodospirillaceae bacterium]
MANLRKWNAPESWTSILTTELNSLANAGYCSASTAADNSSGLYEWLFLSITLGTLNPTGFPYVEVHWLQLNRDGSTYADRGDATFLVNIPVTTGNAAKYANTQAPIWIPPTAGKFVLGNRTNVTMASSGNILAYARAHENLNG